MKSLGTVAPALALWHTASRDNVEERRNGPVCEGKLDKECKKDGSQMTRLRLLIFISKLCNSITHTYISIAIIYSSLILTSAPYTPF